MLMNIYIDTDIFNGYIDNTIVKIHKNLSNFLLADGPKKAIFHAPFPRHKDFDHLAQVFNTVYDVSEQIILLVSELHDVTVNFIEKHDKTKIVYFLNGDLNFKISQAQVYHWDNWFETTAGFYKRNQHLLDKLNPYQPKPYYFDILLGQERPHRNYIFDYINENKLNDRMIMTYMTTLHQRLQDRDNLEWIWESEGVEIPEWSIRHTITKVKYYDQLISLSQIVPISIYNQTAYSLVAETWGNDNRFTFNTEKIVKPILAERLFLVASNQYYLRNLRRLGFKTFDGIVDESYDLESDHTIRCELVCQQIEYLLAQPQEKILEQIRPIAEHNKNMMLTTSWHDTFARDFKEVILR